MKICVTKPNQPPIVCQTIQEAARVLLLQNPYDHPSVEVGDEKVIRASLDYVPGDCYEPNGYEALNEEARVALSTATVMQRIERKIFFQAADAKGAIKRQCISAKRMIRRRLFTSTGKIRRFPLAQ